MEVTKRLRNNNCCFVIAGAVAMFSFLAYLHQESLSQAAEPSSKPTIACAPNRPIAHPGETVIVRVWIDGSPDTKYVKWEKPSVGTIKETTPAEWLFPEEDTSVSTEAPATVQVFAKHKTLGEVACQIRVYFVPAPIITLGPKQPPILSGRTFLVETEKEPEGYGLYTYILFGAPPGDASERERYLEVLESYLVVVRPIEQIENYRKKHELNLTLIPLLDHPVIHEKDVTEPKQIRELAIKLLDIYNYGRAQAILADFGVSKITGGPFLASRRVPAQGTDVLFQDISHVSLSPNLVRDWTETFLMLATQESSWTDQTLQKVRLNMLNVIAVAAQDKSRVDQWIRVFKS